MFGVPWTIIISLYILIFFNFVFLTYDNNKSLYGSGIGVIYTLYIYIIVSTIIIILLMIYLHIKTTWYF